VSQPFSFGYALANGRTRHEIRSKTEAGSLSRLRQGVYIDVSDGSWQCDEGAAHLTQAAAALVNLHGDPVVSYESAAIFWGLPVLGPTTVVHASRTRRCQGTTRSYPGLVLHHAGLPEHHRAEVRGCPVTSPARTVIDIARARPFRAGVVVADAALRYKLCSTEDLMQVARECAAWPGVRRARRVAEFADGRSASPLESISRVAFLDRGLPAPLLQVWVTEAECVDFLWSRQRVIGEADGFSKYATREDLWDEKARQERLADMGYEFVRWGWGEAYTRPDALADRMLRVLVRRSGPTYL
jgi:hypothetical protein